MAERSRRRSLGARLALAFIAVGVLAVGAFAAVMLLTTNSETSKLSASDRTRAARDTARVLADAYQQAGSWANADLTSAQVVATDAGAVLSVRAADGRTIMTEAGGGRGRGRGQGGAPVILSTPVEIDGRTVGTAELRFPSQLTRTQRLLRDKLFGAVLLGSAAAIAIALLGATLVTRTIATPLRQLATAARRLQAGDLSARAQAETAPGELGELSRAFDDMAQTLDRERGARQRLVSDLSHEVRTPLAILQGNLEELVDEVAEPTPTRLASLHEEVLRLGRLVEDLDALAHAEAPVAVVDCQPVSLADLTAAQLEGLRPALDSKGLIVEQRLSPITVSGDRARLGQLLANLLGNAVKFTPDGGTIHILLEEVDGCARLTVRDTGPGVTEAERAHVFERFWRGSSTAGTSGHGIGLAVASEIARAHRGRIDLREAEGGGAAFTVTLPISTGESVTTISTP
jgi:two-component system sensor histidine kinase BaeS